MSETSHASGCDCTQHRGTLSKTGGWAGFLPVLACLVCPACLSTYAKVASFLGIGFSLTEAAHLGVLVVAVGLSLAVSGWRTLAWKSLWPIGITLCGCSLLVLSHFLDDSPWLLWPGIVILLGGGLWERQAHRQRHLKLRQA